MHQSLYKRSRLPACKGKHMTGHCCCPCQAPGWPTQPCQKGLVIPCTAFTSSKGAVALQG